MPPGHDGVVTYLTAQFNEVAPNELAGRLKVNIQARYQGSGPSNNTIRKGFLK